MIKSRLVAFSARFSSLVRVSGCVGLGVVLLASVAAAPPVNTQGPDEQYIHIMAIIDRADALHKAGQTEAARAKYVEAERALLYFKAANPLFAPKTVAYRLKEVSDLADVRPAIPPATNSAGTSNLEAPAAPKTNVKLLEAGAEPRTVLRYHVTPGDKQSALLTWKYKVDAPMLTAAPGGAPAPQTPPQNPEISVPIDYAVQGVAANGDVTYTATFGEATIAQDTNMPPETLQQLQTAFAGIKGVSSSWLKTSRGVTKRLDVKAAATTNLLVRQMVDQFSETANIVNVELPEEAVGPGAKWEAKNTTKIQTTTVTQTENFELVSVDGNKLATKFDVTIEAGTGSGKAAATGLSGTESGTVSVDLSKLVPPSSKVNLHIEVPLGRDKSQAAKIDATLNMDAQ
jgi:hypothetical protein